MQNVDLTNVKVNFLNILHKVTEVNGKKVYGTWKCQCCCGKITYKSQSKLVRKLAISCGCKKQKIGQNNKGWKGYGELSADFFGKYRLGAKQRNIQFDISIEYAWKLLQNQKFICPLTGETLTLPGPRNERRRYTGTASLDRIDNKLGYIEGNVRWIHKKMNKLKWDWTDEELLYWCKKVVEWQSQKNS